MNNLYKLTQFKNFFIYLNFRIDEIINVYDILI